MTIELLDAALNTLSPKTLQGQAEALQQPVIDLLRTDPLGAMDRLAALYPDLDDAAIQAMLTRLVFVSDVWGRFHTNNS
ncbi:MAG: DUF935 family protein [Magnetococcales bacterium]|nr:DUF935 family protein [Magnetococcales bacterium]